MARGPDRAASYGSYVTLSAVSVLRLFSPSFARGNKVSRAAAMGAKLTRLQDTVNNTRQRVSSSLAKRTSSSRASNGAVADLEDGCCSDGSKGCNGEDAAEDHHAFDVSNHGAAAVVREFHVDPALS
ncbi:hypothetical protein RRG08_057784 [Elysia crispata]|uniref:Uncharacterized protein n=1 Tax=Elysia crispata TaxID=231223 RepID=A0AAE0Z3W2_9GAST|nr:hypothetical protein RRG08_057784 [Elysia crispata]